VSDDESGIPAWLAATLNYCSRCGAPLNPPSPSLRERLRGLLRRQAQGEPPDWETITSSQYTRQAHTDNNDGGTTTG